MQDSLSQPGIWIASPPEDWPQRPESMSVSLLAELETCPRRWAWGAGTYSGLWAKPGYPSRFSLAATEGTLVHRSLRDILGELRKSGCRALGEPESVRVLKASGGFSSILRKHAEESVRDLQRNPRISPRLYEIRTALLARIPELRVHLQTLLSRVDLVSSSQEHSSEKPTVTGSGARHELGKGSHGEVWMEAKSLGWRGIADLISLSDHDCEIREFKTGGPKPKHEFQLLVYALLWWRDLELNPGQRLASRLVISYLSGDELVEAPQPVELRALEDELRSRTQQVLEDLETTPPKARPSSDSCAFCDVRQLCDPYWEHLGRTGDSLTDGAFVDLELTITGRRGPRSWEGRVECCANLSGGETVLLRTGEPALSANVGDRLRVMGVKLSSMEPEQDQEAASGFLATMGIWGEAFLVPP